MHMHDLLRPALFVQIVDVLGNHHHLAVQLGLQPGKGAVRSVGGHFGGLRAAGVVEVDHQFGVAGETFGRRHVFDPVLRPEAI